METITNYQNKPALVEALESFACLIFEVSKNQVITNIWGKDANAESFEKNNYLNANIGEIEKTNILHECSTLIEKVFATGQPILIEYNTKNSLSELQIFIRIFKALYDEDFVLITVEKNEPDKSELFFENNSATKNLVNKLQTKNKSLKAEQQKLLSKLKELEDISYAMVHNLRGPARNINLLTQALKIKSGEKSDNQEAAALVDSFDHPELISLIDNLGVSITSNLETLIDIVQIKLNKKIPFDKCNFKKIIQTIIKQLAGDIKKKDIEIISNLDVKKILYPKVYLESIIYNLISNAIKYSGSKDDSKIWINTNLDANNAIVLEVKDNGIGMDMKKFGNKIFKINQVFHKTDDSKGVGLFITKTQIEALGGKITVSSRLNEGSTFTVVFKH